MLVEQQRPLCSRTIDMNISRVSGVGIIKDDDFVKRR